MDGANITINSSHQSDILADFSRSSIPATYQMATDGVEYRLFHRSLEQLNQQERLEPGNHGTDKPTDVKEEVAWIDYHLPPKDERSNLYNI